MRLHLSYTTLATALALVLPAISATVIHSWDFEGDFADGVGSANGTPGANITTTTGYNGGTAMVAPSTVAGTADYVDIADTAISGMVNTGFSVSFWFNIANDSLTINRGFFDFSGNGGDTGIQGLFRGTDGALNFRVDGSGTPNSVIAYVPTVSIEDGAWHHIALTFQRGLSDGFKIYLDGAIGTSSSTTTFLTTTTVGPNASSYLGSFNYTGASETKGLNGALDDFQIWDGVLTPSEISALAVPETSSAMLGLLGVLGILRRRR